MRIALLALLLSGCVSAGTYDELAANRDRLAAECEQDRNAAKAAVAERDKRIADDQRAMDDINAQLAQEHARAAELDAQTRQYESDLANLLKDKSRLSASVDDMKIALADANKRKAEADARIAEYRNLIARFQKLIDAGKLRVKISNGRMVVELATDVLFPSGSAQLSRDGKVAITEVAHVLAEIPDRSFQVEGHTDNIPISTAQYPSNWELASARAVGVLKAMVDSGMTPERISAASFGDSRPAQSNDTPEGRASNRRIEIVLVPDLSSLPGFEELQKASRGS